MSFGTESGQAHRCIIARFAHIRYANKRMCRLHEHDYEAYVAV